MIFVYLGLYMALLLGIWGFYAVARMHSMKFKNFSTHISPITNILMILLIILSISGFVLIFNLDGSDSNYELQITEKNNTDSNGQKNNSKSEKKEQNYEEEIIGDDYY